VRIAITYEVDAQNGRAIQWALNELFTRDLAILASNPRFPHLYSSGVRYKSEPWVGVIEEFAAAPIVLARGWGDCDDLAAWRAAEIVTRLGVRAHPLVVETPQSRKGARAWHCVVIIEHKNKKLLEDPSALLGMLDE
jgi:hypothetical protein